MESLILQVFEKMDTFKYVGYLKENISFRMTYTDAIKVLEEKNSQFVYKVKASIINLCFWRVTYSSSQV